MKHMKHENCIEFLKVFSSIFFKVYGYKSTSKFYVFYPTPEQVEEALNYPENVNLDEWFREDDEYSWYHEAFEIADLANQHAGKVIALIIEKRFIKI